jgi:hypothetical protein
MTTEETIAQVMDELKEMFIDKNLAYGDSLQNGLNVFSKDPVSGILGRLDDKLNRIKAVGINEDTEDTIADLIGYLVHLKIKMKKK